MNRIPLLLYPAKAYLGFAAITGVTSRVISTVALPSGAVIPITTDAVILLAGIVLLGMELIRQMSPRTESYVNHGPSALAAIAATIGFVILGPLGTMTWAAITMMMWVDVAVGLFISARLSSGRNIWIESK
jgi:hypothetical protein